jgi:hypothetical protein
MARLLVVILAAGLVLASAAHAKGPHARLHPGPHPVEPGRPWEATLELNELRKPSHVTLYARSGDRKVTASLRRLPAEWEGQARYRARLTFPSAAPWRVYAATKARSFAFPAVSVGSGRVPADHVAFPDAGRPTPLGPEVFEVASSREDGWEIPLWVFPIAGVVLVGAGIVRVRSR